MPESKFELGVDLIPSDSLLDGLTFDDLILAVHCNCREVTRAAVHAELSRMLAIRKQDMSYLLEKNNKRYLFSGDSIYLEGRLSLINCYGSTMEGYRKNIHKLADQNIDALIPSHYRFTMSGGQNHINQAIEALEYSSLPPML